MITWLVSTAIGLITLAITAKTYRRKTAEDVRLSVFASKKPYKIAFTALSPDDPTRTLHLVTEWECTVVNVGERPVNLVDWTVLRPVSSSVVVFAEIFKIKKATGDIASGEIIQRYRNVYMVEDDERIPWPLDVAPGKSENFKIKMGLPMDKACVEMIQEELNSKRMGDDTQEIFAFLEGKGLTFYGPTIVDKLIPVCFISATGKRFVDVAMFGKTKG